MKGICHITRNIILAAIVIIVGCVTAMAERNHIRYTSNDSITLPTTAVEMPSKRNATSAFPVKLQVKGNSLKVKSNHVQVLPIYTQGGVLYMNMQLSRGTNWLNGLPRGRYRINNRIINIV